jgi:hypothetical protein
LDWLVKKLEVKEFFEVLEIAKRERIWEYAQLQEYQLPYLFATLKDFRPQDSFEKRRACWFRFWFDASVERYDDLWIHREKPPIFWRAWYKLPEKKRKPGIEEMLDSYEMEMSADFIERETTLKPYVKNKVEKGLHLYL